MTIPRGIPQPDGVFGLRVAAALAVKGVIAPEQVVIDAAEIIVRPDGEFLPPMQALRDYLLAQPRPAQVIKWLRIGPSTDLLRDIASGRASIDAVLDTPRPSKPLIYLRTLLLDAGALPRDTAATRQLMAWAAQTISEAPAEHHQMLRTYTRWVLLRRTSRNDSGDIPIGAARHVKASLRGLVAFLTWIEVATFENYARLSGSTRGDYPALRGAAPAALRKGPKIQ